ATTPRRGWNSRLSEELLQELICVPGGLEDRPPSVAYGYPRSDPRVLHSALPVTDQIGADSWTVQARGGTGGRMRGGRRKRLRHQCRSAVSGGRRVRHSACRTSNNIQA